MRTLRVCLCGAIAYVCGFGCAKNDELHQNDREKCFTNLRKLGKAITTYTSDYDDRMPGPDWVDALAPISGGNPLKCPALRPKYEKWGYSYNKALVFVKLPAGEDAKDIPAIFDSSDTRKNSLGDLSLLPSPPRHGKNHVIFLDGRVVDH
jgi:hypothetical protein